MSREQFTKANFRPETLAMIGQANEILSEYAAQGFTLTLRQLYYQFVARQGNRSDPRTRASQSCRREEPQWLEAYASGTGCNCARPTSPSTSTYADD